MAEMNETFADRLMGLTLPGRSARGRVVRLESVLEQVLSAHDYPAPITHLLGEALVLGALMGGLLKGEQAQMTIAGANQATESSACWFAIIVQGLCAAYARIFDAERLASLGANPYPQGLGSGKAISRSLSRPRGVSAIRALFRSKRQSCEACETYFSQSEQIPTLIRVASRAGSKGTPQPDWGGCRASGRW